MGTFFQSWLRRFGYSARVDKRKSLANTGHRLCTYCCCYTYKAEEMEKIIKFRAEHQDNTFNIHTIVTGTYQQAAAVHLKMCQWIEEYYLATHQMDEGVFSFHESAIIKYFTERVTEPTRMVMYGRIRNPDTERSTAVRFMFVLL